MNVASNRILDLVYEEAKSKQNSILFQYNHICLISDGWSNQHREPVVNYVVVCAWQSPTVPVRSRCLEAVYTSERSHDADFISTDIQRVVTRVEDICGSGSVAGCESSQD